MTVREAVEIYITDMRTQGRINSENTERRYRTVLAAHAEDTRDCDVAKVTRRHVTKTLDRWSSKAARRGGHTILSSFYGWAGSNHLRPTSPVARVPTPAREIPAPRKLSRMEILALLEASRETDRDRWLITLGLCAGLRTIELREIQGRHFQRYGYVWLSDDMGKRRERRVPVTRDLVVVAEEIAAQVQLRDFVLPGRRSGYVSAKATVSPAALHKQVVKIGQRAGIEGQMSPQSLRHAFAEQMTRVVGSKSTAILLGNARVKDEELPDEHVKLVREFSYRRAS